MPGGMEQPHSWPKGSVIEGIMKGRYDLCPQEEVFSSRADTPSWGSIGDSGGSDASPACTDVACTVKINLALKKNARPRQLGKRAASRALFPDATGCEGVQTFLQQAEHEVRDVPKNARKVLCPEFGLHT